MTRDGLKKIQGSLKHIVSTIVDIQPYTEVRYGSLEGDFTLDTIFGDIYGKAMEAMARATEIEKRMEKQKTPDLPKGTPVMCKLKRGDLWEYQVYRGDGVTADANNTSSSNTGWASICPLSAFKPTSIDWLPEEANDYARR